MKYKFKKSSSSNYMSVSIPTSDEALFRGEKFEKFMESYGFLKTKSKKIGQSFPMKRIISMPLSNMNLRGQRASIYCMILNSHNHIQHFSPDCH
ncbi:hypothetical protein [Porphyromonas sp.]|uniref:hypothetical protein n=1 Tax=Porphyromonas sp. TaxID=1924944 RepID=UPI0026DB2054|nr:hypothetical protein [Porphyromonas sp.]MDO4695158.1 hypothetical protein [Porphyromonas sp.]MDO4770904.1 hypothetical protein [Porphyromonas sp.]